MDAPATAPAKPPRKRPPPRLTRVARIERLTPRVTRVVCEGEELEGFGPPKPGGHMKLFFPAAGYNHKDADAPRPPSRTYTPRLYDASARTLVVDFVLHGEGLAMDWLRNAKPGDPFYLAGPGGGYEIPADAKSLVLVADDTAMPAAGTILEAMTNGCKATVLCEVSDRAEERPLSDRVQADVRWAHLDGAQAGTALERAVRSVEAPGESHWWVAGEAGAMRRIRTYLLKERGVDPTRVHLRGYWRLGEVNHPDHDYGND